mmetsp:Transcript_60559/g.121484  ORF Transcript_60559/g.121484 Transcript_60559/m.121484 type:complete len:230 (-) Transcript_60559:90-779(-)
MPSKMDRWRLIEIVSRGLCCVSRCFLCHLSCRDSRNRRCDFSFLSGLLCCGHRGGLLLLLFSIATLVGRGGGGSRGGSTRLFLFGFSLHEQVHVVVVHLLPLRFGHGAHHGALQHVLRLHLSARRLVRPHRFLHGFPQLAHPARPRRSAPLINTVVVEHLFAHRPEGDFNVQQRGRHHGFQEHGEACLHGLLHLQSRLRRHSFVHAPEEPISSCPLLLLLPLFPCFVLF